MARASRQVQMWCSRSSDHSQTGMPMITVTIVPIISTVISPRPPWCRLRFSHATTTGSKVGTVRANHSHARRRWMPRVRCRDANSCDSIGCETFSSEDDVRDHEHDDNEHDDASDNQS
jgi:hypothetical protein